MAPDDDLDPCPDLVDLKVPHTNQFSSLLQHKVYIQIKKTINRCIKKIII